MADPDASQQRQIASPATVPDASDPPELSEGPTIEIQEAIVRPINFSRYLDCFADFEIP